MDLLITSTPFFLLFTLDNSRCNIQPNCLEIRPRNRSDVYFNIVQGYFLKISLVSYYILNWHKFWAHIQDMSLPGLPLFQHEAMYMSKQNARYLWNMQIYKLDSASAFYIPVVKPRLWDQHSAVARPWSEVWSYKSELECDITHSEQSW